MSENSFGAKDTLEVGAGAAPGAARSYEIFRLDALQQRFDVARLPFSLKVLLENLLRTEGGGSVTAADIEALASWDAKAEPSKEIAFTPARVLMQDFTGVPAVVDLAAMRDAMAEMGGDPAKINPLAPAELVIDHSVQVDAFGTRDAFRFNAEREFERNQERYALPALGPGRVRQLRRRAARHRDRPPGQPRVPGACGASPTTSTGQAYPDTLVGTDSHTTMVNGLGVLGWGVGGIEAEAAMLGQPMSMLIPQVLGFRLHGELPEGATATDLVLTVTQMLRERGVVGMFVEFYGAGLADLPIADRATIGNMSPEFGSTCAIFPIDAETLTYLELSGRAPGADRAGRGLRQGAGPVARRALRGADLLRHDRARPRHRRAEPRRAQAPAGSRPAGRRQDRIQNGAEATTCPPTASRPIRSDEAVAETYPASDPPANGAPGHAQPHPSPAQPAHAAVATLERCCAPHARHPRRRALRARPRPRGDRRDHQLHQHLQPVGDGRRRDPRPQRARTRPAVEALGEDLARARLEGRHRVPRPRRADRAAGGARLQPRRLRLHHLHRQLRPAARTDLHGGRRERPGGRVRALRQPQLRGPHQPGREDELPRLAAAVRRLRARRHHGHRHRRRAARPG